MATSWPIEAARICMAVHPSIAGESEQALDEELVQLLQALRADLGSIHAKLKTVAAARADALSPTLRAWTEAVGLLEHDLEARFPRIFQILGKDPPEIPPARARLPATALGYHADDLAALAVAAREASRFVATALALLPDYAKPSACTAGLSQVMRASAVAHRIMAGAKEVVARLAGPR